MSPIVLDSMIFAFSLLSMLTCWQAERVRAQSAQRSHRRYVAASVRIAACACAAITVTLLSIVQFLQGEMSDGLYGTFAALVWTLLTVAFWVEGEDNWFKRHTPSNI